MSDLISRADALSCFHDWIDRRGDVHTADEMPEYQRIEQLPTAQPEQPEIVRCKDCKYLLPKGSFCSKDMCGLRGMAHYHHVDIHNDFCSWAERREV